MKNRALIEVFSSGLLSLALAIAIPSTLRAQGKPPYDVGAAAAGEESFKTYCSACHGKAAKGDGPLAKDMKVRPADLTQIANKNKGKFPVDRVVKIIDGREPVRGHGSKDMPVWGEAFRTTDNEAQAMERMKQLAHFLWSVQEKPQ